MTVPAEPGQTLATNTFIRSGNVIVQSGSNTGIYGEPKPTRTQDYGKTPYSYHYASGLHSGIDVAEPINNVVTTPLKLKVVGTYYSDNPKGYDPYGYGNYIVAVEPTTGYKVIFGHLNSINVQQGQTIDVGYPIGREGETGNATGPHVHFEVRTSGGSVTDPDKFMAQFGATWQNLFGFFGKSIPYENVSVPYPDSTTYSSSLSGIANPPPVSGPNIPGTTNPPPTDTGLTQSPYYTNPNPSGIPSTNPITDAFNTIWGRFRAWWDGIEKLNVTFVIVGIILLILGLELLVVSNVSAGGVAKSIVKGIAS